MQNRSHAVMAQRHEALDSLEDFPTPPWATRALLERVLIPRGWAKRSQTVWEPACNRGIMAETLREYFPRLIASDIHAYPDYRGRTLPFVEDFLDPHPPAAPVMPLDWIITNPPFRLAADFALRALSLAPNVALFVRTSWLEGAGRYMQLFRPYPPTLQALFVERVPLVKGRWDPDASTATSYTWLIWTLPRPRAGADFTTTLIPNGQRSALTKPDDVSRFAERSAAPLLDLPRAHSPELAGGAT